MCNAMPGTRCLTDTTKALNTKYQNLEKFQDGKDFSNLSAKDKAKAEKLADDIYKQKIAVFSTAEAQKNVWTGHKLIKQAEQGLSPSAVEFLKSTAPSKEAQRIGGYVHKFQSLTDDYRKKHPEKSQVEVARLMESKVFESMREKGLKQLSDEHRERIEALEGTPAPNGERNFEDREDVAASYDKYTNSMIALEKACDIAQDEAGSVITRDQSKNSSQFSYRGVSANYHRSDYKKNRDGSFTVSTMFHTNAGSYAEAIERIENSFTIDDFQITTNPNEKGGWNTKVTYVYKGGEALTDATENQRKVFRGTPAFRDVIEDMDDTSDRLADRIF